MSARLYLEWFTDDGHLPHRYDFEDMPVIVGRHADCELRLNLARISRQHAQFDTQGDRLILTDLESTNGTFVNHDRLAESTEVNPGDVIHFADHEFRVMADQPVGDDEVDSDATMVGIQTLPRQFPLQARELRELLADRLITGFRQVITDAKGEVYAWELLGRGTHPQLSESPGELFALANAFGEEAQLSRLMREISFEQAAVEGVREPLFFNSHPAECRDFDRLLSELNSFRKRYPNLRFVFEVHEGAVTDLDEMAEVRRMLRKMDIGLAYDDFGAGQARLLELIEVPPDYLKFDISLVRDLKEADSPRYRMLHSLTQLIGGMGIHTLAEGVETELTAQLCRDIGIAYYQGFLFGRPGPISR